MNRGDLVRFIDHPVGSRGLEGKHGVVTAVFMRDEYLLCDVMVEGSLARFVCEEDLEVVNE